MHVVATPEVLEARDASEHLQFVSLTFVHDHQHVYSTTLVYPMTTGTRSS